MLSFLAGNPDDRDCRLAIGRRRVSRVFFGQKEKGAARVLRLPKIAHHGLGHCRSSITTGLPAR
jgi:hypothetical protein